MSVTKHLGFIRHARLGKGGYDGAMFGLTLDFSLDGGTTGCADFIGTWTTRARHAEYTEQDHEDAHGKAYRRIRGIMAEARIDDIAKLTGIPVEVTFDSMKMTTWRVLAEVIQ